MENTQTQELRAFAKSLGVGLREVGKDGKKTKFRGMGALKEACKVVQSRLWQALPEDAQEHSQIAEARRAQPKRKRGLQ